MSAFTRLLHLPASRRTYSSFFSSKSGGGRYFNSSKKSPTVALKNNTNVDPPSEAQKDSVQSGSTNQNAGASQNPIADAQPSQTASGSASSDESPKPVTPQTNAFAELSNSSLVPQLIITTRDFKIHQFFSLHRPLLLISQPTSIFRPVPPNNSIFDDPQLPTAPQNPLGFDPSTSEPSIDADAEAARQLTRALTMNKAGATVSWEDTLRYLGLDVAQEADRVNLQQQFDKEWLDVMMDSTKRKKRKKMKKHKLRKRRRATRSVRLRLK